MQHNERFEWDKLDGFTLIPITCKSDWLLLKNLGFPKQNDWVRDVRNLLLSLDCQKHEIQVYKPVKTVHKTPNRAAELWRRLQGEFKNHSEEKENDMKLQSAAVCT